MTISGLRRSQKGHTLTLQPTFETNRLLLRPRALADTDACLALDRDPEVTRFVRGPWSELEAHRAFVQARTVGPYAPGLGYWAVCQRDDQLSLIGWVIPIPNDAVGPEIEIRWRLVRAAWGRGLATEAARLILRHAFMTLNLPEVVADIAPNNIGSVRVAASLNEIGQPDR
jgi:RimJ/RimL family protein N-acetyltransferase